MMVRTRNGTAPSSNATCAWQEEDAGWPTVEVADATQLVEASAAGRIETPPRRDDGASLSFMDQQTIHALHRSLHQARQHVATCRRGLERFESSIVDDHVTPAMEAARERLERDLHEAEVSAGWCEHGLREACAAAALPVPEGQPSVPRVIGVIRWFRPGQSYGFADVPGAESVFVPNRGLAASGIAAEDMVAGTRLEFEVTTDRRTGKPQTANVRLLERAA